MLEEYTMEGKRKELDDKLRAILGTSNVYFQPPPSVRMNFPAIVYSLESEQTIYADNRRYMVSENYELIVVDLNPDWADALARKILSELPYCKRGTSYNLDGLTHIPILVHT